MSARRGEAVKAAIHKAGRFRAPATGCFFEVREFAVWKKENLFGDFGTKSSPARYQTAIPVCNPFLTGPVGSVVSAVPVILPGLSTGARVCVANTLGEAVEDLPRNGSAA